MAKVTITLTLKLADLVRDIVRAEYESESALSRSSGADAKVRHDAALRSTQIELALREFA